MRDLIARALAWALGLILPGKGEHRATPEHAHPLGDELPADEHQDQESAPVFRPDNPWLCPWTTPTKEEAAAIFARQEAAAEEAKRTRDRRRAAVLADMGQDYPYTFPGAPFGADAFNEGAAA
ncbi:hypothetical protein [Streptomyces harbinensis]